MHSTVAKRQQGMTLIGLMFFCALLIFFVYAGFRLVPPYIDYYAVKHALNELSTRPDLIGKNERAYREAFQSHIDMDRIEAVDVQDLDIELLQNGARLTAEWNVKRPFIGPVHLCLDFRAESAPPFAAQR